MPQNTHLETISAETERLPEPVHAAHPIAPQKLQESPREQPTFIGSNEAGDNVNVYD
jgi:hypothetical protein